MMKATLRAYQKTVGFHAQPTPVSLTKSILRAMPGITPWRSVLVIVASIFTVELFVMLGLTWADGVHPFYGLVDALAVAVFSFFLLQRLVLRPLLESQERLQNEVKAHRHTLGELKLQSTALRAAAHGIMITDRDGKIVWVNPAFTTMTGYRSEEVCGQSPKIISSGNHDDAFYVNLWRTILAGRVWRGETTNRRKDGTHYIEEQTITPVQDDTGQITHFISIKNDCSARKRTETELARRSDQLVELGEMERHQRQFAEALANSARSLNASLVLEEVLDAILEQTQVMIPCRAVVVMLLRGDWIDVVRHRDITGATNSLTRGFSLDHFPGFRAMVEQRNAKLVIDTRTEPDWTDIPGLEWIRSFGVVPLIENNCVTGFLAVVSERAAFADQDTLNCLTAFAAQATMALRNARLFRAERDARHIAETLAAANVELTRTLQLEGVLDSLLRHLNQLVAYDGAHIALLVDDAYLNVEIAAGDDPWRELDSVRQLPMIDVTDCSLIQTLMKEGRSTIVEDSNLVENSPYFAALGSFQSWLGVPIVVGDSVVGLCGLQKRTEGHFTAEHVRLAEAVVAQAALAIQNATLFQQVKTGSERLQLLSHRLVQIQENERKAVARELHDQAGQVLTSLKIGLRQLSNDLNDPEALGAKLSELYAVTDSVFDDLHRLAMNLRPATLDHLGLVAAICDHVANLNQQYESQIRFEVMGMDEPIRLAADLETALYRVVQEALTNVVRHAEASRVDLLLHFYPDQVRLTIEDNGVGFDRRVAMKSSQMGMLGMRERCEMLGGRLEVESIPNAGTTIVAELPRELSERSDGIACAF